jgi:hypothetical protein
MAKLRLKVGRRHEVVGSAGADVVRAPSSTLVQSNRPDGRLEAPLSGRVPSTETGDQLLSGHPAPSEATRRVSQYKCISTTDACTIPRACCTTFVGCLGDGVLTTIRSDIPR